MKVKLFADVILVRGYTRSLLLDLTRDNPIHLIPNYVAVLIQKYNGVIDTDDIIRIYGDKYAYVVTKWMNYLFENELIFRSFDGAIGNFLDIGHEYNYPFPAESILIELSLQNQDAILNFLSSKIYKLTRNIGIVIYNEVYSSELLHSLISKISLFEKISVKIVLHSKYEKEAISILNKFKEKDALYFSFDFYAKKINCSFFKNSNIIRNYPFLIPNFPLYIENLNYNSYLYKKIFIDSAGFIRQSPELSENFGHIKDNTLEELLSLIKTASYQKYWNVNKDKILICKDCELRYICIDNRPLFFNKKSDIWFCETDCLYNPYIAKWADEKGYISVKECNTIQGEISTFIPNKIFISNVIGDLWGEDI